MNKQLPPSELRFHDLSGVVAINLHEREDFNLVASRLAGYDPARMEAVAFRVYIQYAPVVTIYAVDKENQYQLNERGKLPVHKFKLETSIEALFAHFKQLNFTVTTGEHGIENMEVIDENE